MELPFRQMPLHLQWMLQGNRLLQQQQVEHSRLFFCQEHLISRSNSSGATGMSVNIGSMVP